MQNIVHVRLLEVHRKADKKQKSVSAHLTHFVLSVLAPPSHLQKDTSCE